MPAPNEDQLVAQARKGSQEAFAALVRAYEGAVYSLCYRMAGNAPEAEDLAQEAFLRFYRSLDRLRAGAPVRPWLHKIAVNTCLDALRQRKQTPLSLDELPEGSPPPQSPQGETPEAVCLSREVRLDVQKALLRLPGDYRAALVLRYLEGLSYQETASALGVPVSTVETRIFRAKKMLGSLLAPLQTGEKEEA